MSAPLHTGMSELALAAMRVGRAKCIFNAIRVDYPPQTAVIAALAEVCYAAKGRPPGTDCGGAMVVAPHGCGKSEAVQEFTRIMQAQADPGQKPVVHCTISTAGTTDSVPSSILKALCVARWDAGNEKSRWARAIAESQRFGVKLFVFDEFNRAARRDRVSGPIATSIRENIMDAGIAPVAFVGSEDASAVLAKVPELMERLDDNIDLSPMRWDTEGDRQLFLDFVSDLDQAMVEKRVLSDLSGLADEEIARPLWEASSGRLRRIIKIVRHAMATALHDNRGAIEHGDLVEAVDAYCISRKFCLTNPFLKGGSR